MPLSPGSRLGPYAILDKVGSGGMGEVYRARDERLGRDVAVKVLPESVRADRDRLRRFEIEARAAGALSHPNIVAVHDFDATGETPYIVSELLEGSSLRDYLPKTPLPWRTVLGIAEQLAAGLAAAHAKGIIHRDLKPENIFILADGRVKILDFGLAKSIIGANGQTAPTADGTWSATDHTASGAILGSAGYMSPEQVQGKPADQRSDFFAFGVVLYEMLAGRRAFDGSTPVEKAYAILHSEPAELPPDVPRALDELVRRCLAKNPDRRFQSAADLLFFVQTVGEAPSRVESAPREIPKEPKARYVRYALLIGVGLLAGLLFSIFAIDREREPPEMELSLEIHVAEQIEEAQRLEARMRRKFARGLPQPPVAPDPPTVPQAPGEDGDEVRYRQLTFRRGHVLSGRFAPDGHNVVYGAAWDGGPPRTFVTVPGNPESRTVIDSGSLLAISKSGEMALSLQWEPAGKHIGVGALARAPFSGGAPRTILENVGGADWSPDGRDLAVIRWSRDSGSTHSGCTLEYPIGKKILETTGWFGDLRVSPSGEMIALTDHPTMGDDAGTLAVVGRDGQKITLGPYWSSLRGVAWDPSGEEIWFTAAQSYARAIFAATLDGQIRLVAQTPANLILKDIGPDGRVLLKRTTERVGLRAVDREEERELGWFDMPFDPVISRDANTLVFTEWSEATRGEPMVYSRSISGSPAVALGPGFSKDMSPDGTRVLVIGSKYDRVTLLPVGPGHPIELPPGPITSFVAAHFLPDGKRVLLAGREGSGPTRLYVQELDGAEPKQVGPDAIAPKPAQLAVVGRGDAVIVPLPDGGVYRLFLDTSSTQKLASIGPFDQIAGFTSDGRTAFVFRHGKGPHIIDRVELESGRSTRFREIASRDLSGTLMIGTVRVAREGKLLVYSYASVESALFIGENLR